MKKTIGLLLCLLLTVLLTAALADVGIRETHFPDENFRKYLKTFDTDDDGRLSNDEINDMKVMDVSGLDIADLTGLRNIWAVEELDCSGNPLESLYLSQNPRLVTVRCDYTDRLEEIELGNNPNLKTLLLRENRLSSLDLSYCPALEYLDVDGNRLTSLDLSRNPALESLYVGGYNSSASGNPLSTLILSNNKALRHLGCSYTAITRLDVSACPELKKLVQNNRRIYGEDDSEEYFAMWDCWSDSSRYLEVRQDATVIAGKTVSFPLYETVKGLRYKLNQDNKTAMFCGPQNSSIKSLTIPTEIVLEKVHFKVTEIREYACQNLKKLAELTIGKNVTAIGKEAFRDCKKLKKITIAGTKLKKAGAKAFTRISASAVVRCVKSYIKKYQKLLRSAGLAKSIPFKAK